MTQFPYTKTKGAHTQNDHFDLYGEGCLSISPCLGNLSAHFMFPHGIPTKQNTSSLELI